MYSTGSLPSELSKNDYENLYKEMKKDINNSIKELDFEALSVCLGKVKFAKRVEYNYRTPPNMKEVADGRNEQRHRVCRRSRGRKRAPEDPRLREGTSRR